MKALRLPTLVGDGTHDASSTAEMAQALIGCLHSPRSLLLPEVGHLPNLESPDLFNRELLAFLEAAYDARG